VAAGDDAAHVAVGGDAPANRNHTAAEARRIDRLGREARPEHDAVRQGVAGRDAERERVAAE
jgi:hypothetical protein